MEEKGGVEGVVENGVCWVGVGVGDAGFGC